MEIGIIMIIGIWGLLLIVTDELEGSFRKD